MWDGSAGPNLEAGGGTEVAAFLRAAPASLKLARAVGSRWAPRQCRGSRSSLLLCLAQGLPAESNLDEAELILNLLNPGFSGSAGPRSPRLVLLLWLQSCWCCLSFPVCKARRWGGLRGCCLTPTLNTCEVTPPRVRV